MKNSIICLSTSVRFVVPMKNGDLESKGLLASIIQAEGTIESFKVCIFFYFFFPSYWQILKLQIMALGNTKSGSFLWHWITWVAGLLLLLNQCIQWDSYEKHHHPIFLFSLCKETHFLSILRTRVILGSFCFLASFFLVFPTYEHWKPYGTNHSSNILFCCTKQIINDNELVKAMEVEIYDI